MKPLIVDTKALETTITKGNGPLEYAPPALRDNVAAIPVTEIETTTKELEEIMAAAKAEVADLERHTMLVRSLYIEHTKKIVSSLRRLRDSVRLSMKTMEELRKQCVALDEPIEEPAPPAEPAP